MSCYDSIPSESRATVLTRGNWNRNMWRKKMLGGAVSYRWTDWACASSRPDCWFWETKQDSAFDMIDPIFCYTQLKAMNLLKLTTSVSWGCCNKIPQSAWLLQQKCLVGWFWRLQCRRKELAGHRFALHFDLFSWFMDGYPLCFFTDPFLCVHVLHVSLFFCPPPF